MHSLLRTSGILFRLLRELPRRAQICSATVMSACREMTHFKGESDPLKGDVPNQKVRDAAREALDALFGADSGYASAVAPAPQLTVKLVAARIWRPRS